jgi:hypothetical protein
MVLKVVRLDRQGSHMVERFFYTLGMSSIFPVELQHALLCMQFSYYAGNIADGALIQKNTVHFHSSVLREILEGKGLFHVTGICKHLCYDTLFILKGYRTCPLFSALKGIEFL